VFHLNAIFTEGDLDNLMVTFLVLLAL